MKIATRTIISSTQQLAKMMQTQICPKQPLIEKLTHWIVAEINREALHWQCVRSINLTTYKINEACVVSNCISFQESEKTSCSSTILLLLLLLLHQTLWISNSASNQNNLRGALGIHSDDTVKLKLVRQKIPVVFSSLLESVASGTPCSKSYVFAISKRAQMYTKIVLGSWNLFGK